MTEELDNKSEGTSMTGHKVSTSNAGLFVSYRIPPSDYQSMGVIAKHLHAMGKIKSPTVSALAKSCLYTQVNLFMLIEAQNQQAIQYDKQMKDLQESIARNRVPPFQKNSPW
jgi:hypothetical protein